MITLAYDQSFAGFLTVIFELYQRFDAGKQLTNCFNIVKYGKHQDDLFENFFLITTDADKSSRVEKKLIQLLGSQGIKQLIWGFLSEDKKIENCLFSVIRYAIDNPKQDVLKNFAHPDVLQLAKWVKSVRRERHRMIAFVRFEKMDSDVFLARIEPDFNVLPLIIKHFKSRYKNQKWIIYDMRRQYGVFSDMQITYPIDSINDQILRNSKKYFSAEEINYQALWKDYFNSLNIKERNNPELHIRQLPRRYWKYLTEKLPV